jgi:predicted CopG family antitoxin
MWPVRGKLTLRVFFVCLERMRLKTVSVDLEAFRLLRKAKGPRESYGDVVRRVFADYGEVGVDEFLAELRANPPKVNVELLRRRQKQPVKSNRPARRAHAV